MALADALTTTGADLALPQRQTQAPVPTSAASAPAPSGREGVVAFWMGKGAPEHVAQAIADSVQRESGFKPGAWSPDDKGSPSGGQYQHHAERLAGLQGAALAAGVDWRDPNFQHEYAYKEVMGKDPIAAKHWQEILAAPDRATAQTLWDKYFERGAVVGGGAGGGGGTRRMVGRMGGMGPGVPAGAAGKPAASADPDFTDDEQKEIDRLKLKMARLAAAAAPPEHEPEPLAVQAAPKAAAPAPAKPTFNAHRFAMPTPAAPMPVSLTQAIQIAPGNPLTAALKR